MARDIKQYYFFFAFVAIFSFNFVALVTFYGTFNTPKSIPPIQFDNDNSLLYSLAESNTKYSEEQYWFQRGNEVTDNSVHPFMNYAANWPCYWGESFIVSNQSYNYHNNIDGDGGKWVCGAKYLTNPCIVYSLGSNNNWKFEYGLTDVLLQQNINCTMFTFDPFNGPNEKEVENLLPNIKFYEWGISDRNNDTTKMYTLPYIMQLLNHTHIDILKIDIEGSEYPVFYALDNAIDGQIWPSIGQILIEIHPDLEYERVDKYKMSFGQNKSDGENAKERLGAIIDVLEKHNFRLFHNEPNVLWNPFTLSEYSFIQKDYRPHVKHYNY